MQPRSRRSPCAAIEEQRREAARPERRAGGARHPPRGQRADGRGHPPRLDQPRHRSARVHAGAVRRRRARCTRPRSHASSASTRIIVPRYPGVLCAAGLLSAMVEHEASAAFMRTLADVDPARHVTRSARNSAQECAARMREEGIAAARVETSCYADVCYVGQAYHIEVPLELDGREHAASSVVRASSARCTTRSTATARDRPARSSTCASVQRAANPVPVAGPLAAASAAQARKGTRRDPARRRRRIRRRARLRPRRRWCPGRSIDGPAIIEQTDTTTLVEPGWQRRGRRATEVLITHRATTA